MCLSAAFVCSTLGHAFSTLYLHFMGAERLPHALVVLAFPHTHYVVLHVLFSRCMRVSAFTLRTIYLIIDLVRLSGQAVCGSLRVVLLLLSPCPPPALIASQAA